MLDVGMWLIRQLLAVRRKRQGEEFVGWMKYNREIIYGDERDIQPRVLHTLS